MLIVLFNLDFFHSWNVSEMSHSVEVKFQCVCICVQQTLVHSSRGVKHYMSTGLSIWEAMTGRTGKVTPLHSL